MNYTELIEEINKAFFRLESFMNGTLKEYHSFDFSKYFTELFNETKKDENFTYSNCESIGKYWALISQICEDYDKSDFINTDAYENESFCNDCNDLDYLHWHRIDEFCEFSTPDELENEKKFSITDIIKNSQKLHPQQKNEKQSHVSKKIIIGSISNELNLIRQKFRETGKISKSFIKYYNLIEQPTQVKDILKKVLIPFDNNMYFGGYWNHLNRPFIKWNGFYIQPFKYESLMNFINEGKIFYNGKIISDINEIKEYIISYREGFELGYNNFDEIEIINKSGVFFSDERSLKRINDYVEYNFSDFNHGFTFQSYIESIGFYKDFSQCKFRLVNKTCSRIEGEQPLNICELCDLYTLPDLQSWKTDGLKNGKYYKAWYYIISNSDLFDEYIEKALQPQQKSKQSENVMHPQQNFIANEYALAYILDLHTNGKQLPINRIEGSLNKKELVKIGKEKGFNKPDTFYRAVKKVVSFDLNKETDLQFISKDWIKAVENLSDNWEKTKQYLINKKLIRD